MEEEKKKKGFDQSHDCLLPVRFGGDETESTAHIRNGMEADKTEGLLQPYY